MKKGIQYFVLGIEVIVVISLVRGLVSNLKAKNKLRDLRERKEKLVQEQGVLEKQLAKTKRKDYLEYVAREKLNLVKEGETLVIVDRQNKSQKNEKDQKMRDLSNWQKWRRVVLGW